MVPQLLQGKALNPNLAFEALHSPDPIAWSQPSSSLTSLYVPGGAHMAYLLSPPPFTIVQLSVPSLLPSVPLPIPCPICSHFDLQQPLQLFPAGSLAPFS
jgi:hypothetical protein